MLKRQACAKFQSQIFDESEVIQILKVVRWHFCQVYKPLCRKRPDMTLAVDWDVKHQFKQTNKH